MLINIKLFAQEMDLDLCIQGKIRAQRVVFCKK